MEDKVADVLAKYFKDPIDAECSYCEAAKEVTRIVRAQVATHLTKIMKVNINGNGIRSELGRYIQTLKNK